ncbi:oligosaccharide flippase family protein [Pseudonocardia kunmingensis]|uniref:O-antigen/teichoic acid export membrane protein n=1 Tax=Pseudonocardia kunmingensis TaxID=630975 RepID=A0A543DKI6_9PSEU|nr:oligosaccharide flippase family protein [Pseudonocardia kunmingensis]TQM09842.1 O-antigen/teichoic acid export membrane protein [Pseudonocardia kunmingensis]
MVDLRVERSATTGGFVLVAAVGAASVLNYGFGVALAWLLPQDEFGVVGVLFNLLSLAAFVLTAGFPWAVARSVAHAGVAGRSAATDIAVRGGVLGNLGLGLTLATGFVVVQSSTGRLLPGAGWGWTAAIAVALVLLSLSNVVCGALQGARRFDAIAITSVAEILVKVVLGLAFVALLGWGVSGVVVAVLLGVVVAVVVSYRSGQDKLPGPGPVAGGTALAQGLPMAIGTVSFGMLATLDVLLLNALGHGHGVTVATVAVYQAASILARAPYFLSDAISDAMFPFVAGGRTARDAHNAFMTAFQWVPLVFVPLLLVLVITPGSVVDLVFPGEYGGAADVARVIALGTIGLIVTDMLQKALFARGFARAVAIRLPCAAVLQVLTLVVLVPRLGAIGAAVGFAVGTWGAAALVGVLYLRHHRPGRPRLDTIAQWVSSLVLLGLVLAGAALASRPLDLALIAAGLTGYAALAVRLGLLPDAVLRRVKVPRPPAPPRAEPPTTPIRSVRRRRWWRLDPATVPAFCAALAFVPFWWNLGAGPDTMYDEVSYVIAAQNVAQGWSLTWTAQPVFVHPPLAFLAEAGWLGALGFRDAPVEDAVHVARILASTMSVLAVLLLALITTRLAAAAGQRRRIVLAGVVLALAATDPILLRYLRLVLIEPFALFASLLALLLAIWLRNQPAVLYVPVVGLATGIALLTKEMSVVLVAVPVLHAVLGRNGRAFARSAGALGAGVLLWLAFPLWAMQLGLWPQFSAEKFLLVERLFGLVQTTGWNRPGFSFASFLDAVLAAGSEYASSYVLLAGGLGALAWLVLHRVSEVSRWLLAWLLLSYAYACYTVLLGSLNEHLFVFVLPAAIVGTVLVTDAVVSRRVAAFRALGRGRGRRLLVVPVVALVGMLAFASASWVRSYVPDGDGVMRSAAYVRDAEESCAVNAIGDSGKWAPFMPDQLVTDYATGSAARSHGIQLYFLSGKDAATGNALPELSAWVMAKGTLEASFPSVTYRGIEVWRVPRDPYDPLADLEPVENGFYVTTEGSRCAGYYVADTPVGALSSTWRDLGGKAVVGPPATGQWTEGTRAVQVFDGAVLIAEGPQLGAARPIVADLANRAPTAYRAAQLPPLTQAARTDDDTLALLTDPTITAAYAGVNPTPEALDAARVRLGVPLGPVKEMPDGAVRQAFAGGVLEREAGATHARLAPVGKLALDVGLLRPPDEARSAEPPPPLLAEEAEEPEPTSVEPFVQTLGVLVAGFLALSAVGGVVRLRRRRFRPDLVEVTR